MNVMFVLCQLFCRSSQLILNYLKKADTRRRAQILHFIIIFSKHYMTEIMTRTLTARTSYKVKLLPLYTGTGTRKTLQPAPGQWWAPLARPGTGYNTHANMTTASGALHWPLLATRQYVAGQYIALLELTGKSWSLVDWASQCV